MSEPTTAAGRARRTFRGWLLNEVGATGDGEWSDRVDEFLDDIEAEARAIAATELAAEKERLLHVEQQRARLREALERFCTVAQRQGWDGSSIGALYDAYHEARAALKDLEPQP